MAKNATILILDDDAAFVDAARKSLEARGYRVEGAASCREALEKLPVIRPSLIILEPFLNGKSADGLFFARKLKRSSAWGQYRGVPLVAVTGLKGRTDLLLPTATKNAYRVPVDELLEKPVEQDALARLVAELIA